MQLVAGKVTEPVVNRKSSMPAGKRLLRQLAACPRNLERAWATTRCEVRLIAAGSTALRLGISVEIGDKKKRAFDVCFERERTSFSGIRANQSPGEEPRARQATSRKDSGPYISQVSETGSLSAQSVRPSGLTYATTFASRQALGA